jgi:transcriptional regulator with XRE-family HTH domain
MYMSASVADEQRIKNGRIGEQIGLSYAQVSRIRNGTRRPSVETMLRIEDVYHWSAQAQLNARRAGTYATEFEARVVDFYRAEPNPE